MASESWGCGFESHMYIFFPHNCAHFGIWIRNGIIFSRFRLRGQLQCRTALLDTLGRLSQTVACYILDIKFVSNWTEASLTNQLIITPALFQHIICHQLGKSMMGYSNPFISEHKYSMKSTNGNPVLLLQCQEILRRKDALFGIMDWETAAILKKTQNFLPWRVFVPIALV